MWDKASGTVKSQTWDTPVNDFGPQRIALQWQFKLEILQLRFPTVEDQEETCLSLALNSRRKSPRIYNHRLTFMEACSQVDILSVGCKTPVDNLF